MDDFSLASKALRLQVRKCQGCVLRHLGGGASCMTSSGWCRLPNFEMYPLSVRAPAAAWISPASQTDAMFAVHGLASDVQAAVDESCSLH